MSNEVYTPHELELVVAWSDRRRDLLEKYGMPFEGVVERTDQAQRAIAKIKSEAYIEGANSVHVGGDFFDIDAALLNNPYEEKK